MDSSSYFLTTFFSIWVHIPWSMFISFSVIPALPMKCFILTIIFFMRFLSPLGTYSSSSSTRDYPFVQGCDLSMGFKVFNQR